MALIRCPECGNVVSDKAVQCPKCGYPMSEMKVSVHELPNNQKNTKAIETKKWASIYWLILVALVSIGIGIMLIRVLLPSSLTVKDAIINEWRLTESSEHLDRYDATLTSSQKQPFAAVVGFYNTPDYNGRKPELSMPDLVYMEDGTGTFETDAYLSHDVSTERVPIGYIPCKKCFARDLESVDYNISDYSESDRGGTTSCLAEVEVEMKKKRTGILIVDISNDTNNYVLVNQKISIVNGCGKVEGRIYDLPWKSRGIELTVTPRAFCEAKSLSDGDYTIPNPFSIDSEKDLVGTKFMGNETIKMGDICKTGYLLYTCELINGGSAVYRNIVENHIATIDNHIVNISTFYYDNVNKHPLTPQYSIIPTAYLPILDFDK